MGSEGVVGAERMALYMMGRMRVRNMDAFSIRAGIIYMHIHEAL
jgi:hypothetical protein